MQYYIYILASKPFDVLYIGVTNNLLKRLYQHKSGTAKSFSKKYNVTQLVYFEITSSINTAISKEKQLKNWKRQWKVELIEKENPCRDDLSLKF